MKKYIVIFTLILVSILGLITIMAQEESGLSERQQHYADAARQVVETFWNSESTEEQLTALETEVFIATYTVHRFFEMGVINTRNGMMSSWTANTLFQRTQDMSVTVEQVFVAENAVTVIAIIEATPTRDWLIRGGFMLPAQEEPISWEYLGVFHFNEDGLIDEVWHFVDIPDIVRNG